ncbi:putative ubiquitin conjugation factor E4 [Platanthera zijinensis]|uniref:Ubiquitin conjugation factor E4 n=1 Tax=Platanthera zijinensis TaxID=2320716 RepID=A0AAP0B6A3_9ASPA
MIAVGILQLGVEDDEVFEESREEFGYCESSIELREERRWGDGDSLTEGRFVIIWFVTLIGGLKIALPVVCPMEFACMPEHFIEDAMDLLILTSRIPRALDGFLQKLPLSHLLIPHPQPSIIETHVMTSRHSDTIEALDRYALFLDEKNKSFDDDDLVYSISLKMLKDCIKSLRVDRFPVVRPMYFLFGMKLQFLTSL